MLKKLLVLLAAGYAAAAMAAVDANKANAAELETIKGIGSGMSAKILEERKKGAFKNWDDLKTRVKGIGEKNAAKLSGEGLTVGGASYGNAKPAGKTADRNAAGKSSDKSPAKPADEKPQGKK